MTETNFTPGPWFVNGHMTKYVEARIGGGIIQEVAAVGPTDADGGYGSQQEANARLIASAPELYEALDKAMHCKYFVLLSGAVQHEVSAALAKARGDS